MRQCSRRTTTSPRRCSTRHEPRAGETDYASELAGLSAWILGLPWVTERAEFPQAPGVRCFAVDCEPLDRNRTWILVGDIDWHGAKDQRITLVLAEELALPTVAAGHGMLVAPLPSGHHLISFSTPKCEEELELLRTLALAAYMGALR